MCKKTIVIAVFILTAASTPAFAGDLLAQFAFSAFHTVTTAAVEKIGATVKGALKEKPEEKAAREVREVNAAADQLLAGIPDEERARQLPQLVERLMAVQRQHGDLAAGVEAMRAEQRNIGNVVTSAMTGPASNRKLFDAAEAAARNHSRAAFPADRGNGVGLAAAFGAVVSQLGRFVDGNGAVSEFGSDVVELPSSPSASKQ